MYQAKSKGKARFELFEPQMAAAILRRHDMKEELAKAIERQQMIVQYQPIVALDSGRIVAAEALVRWEHPVRGLVPPAEFVPLAEETGLIVPLGRFVLREACQQARRWQDAETDPDVEPLRMHVNLSVAELRDPDLVKNVLASIEESGIEPRPARDRDHRVPAARRRRRGALPRAARARRQDRARRLRHRLLVAVLPALAAAGHAEDRQAVHRRPDRRAAARSSFVGMIVDLARTLELEVIAEGIETAEQLAALRELKAGLGQGYFLGRPSAAAPRLGRSART